jgi:hypothetical protein
MVPDSFVCVWTIEQRNVVRWSGINADMDEQLAEPLVVKLCVTAESVPLEFTVYEEIAEMVDPVSETIGFPSETNRPEKAQKIHTLSVKAALEQDPLCAQLLERPGKKRLQAPARTPKGVDPGDLLRAAAPHN